MSTDLGSSATPATDPSALEPEAEPHSARSARTTRLSRGVSASYAALRRAVGFLGGVRVLDRFSALIVALSACLFVLVVTPYERVFEIDPDEGNNLIKALLLDRGYRFLDEIWSDQPPLFAELLRIAFNWFGWEPSVGRTLVLGFTGLAVFVLYDSLRKSGGHVAALLGVCLLFLSEEFMPLCVSIMIGLPSIALAMLSAWALERWSTEKGRVWLLLSGVAMALSTATKLFTAFLVPLLVVFVFVSCLGTAQTSRRARFKLAISQTSWWVFAFGLSSVALLWSVLTAADPTALYEPHLIERQAKVAVDNLTGSLMVKKFIEDDAFIISLAAIGVVQAWLRPGKGMRFWALWLVTALVVLRFHQPVWVHHRLLITAPASILAAFAVGGLFRGVTSGEAHVGRWPTGTWWARLAVAVLVTSSVVVAHPSRVKAFRHPPGFGLSARDQEIQAKIDHYAERAEMMVTARQMYAFRAGLPVPPELAVTSVKRFHAGLLNADDIADSIKKHRPGLVVTTLRWPTSVRNNLKRPLENQRYVRVYRDDQNMRAELWVRPDLLDSGDKPLLDSDSRQGEAQVPDDLTSP